MTTSFPPTSRYSGIETAEYVAPDGRTIVYLRRRLVPLPERLALLQEHLVAAGERPDHIAATELGDPEQFWRVCDANGVLRPEELTEEVGRHLRISLPEGIPGFPNA
jgi:hypothetical protein